MENKLTHEGIVRQVNEMWDALNDTPLDDPNRDYALAQGKDIERKLWERFERQEGYSYLLTVSETEEIEIRLPVLLNVGSQFEHEKGRFCVVEILRECPGAGISFHCDLVETRTLIMDYASSKPDGFSLIKAKMI